MSAFRLKRGWWQAPAVAAVVLAAGCAATRSSEPMVAAAFAPSSAFGSYLAAGHAQTLHEYGDAAGFYDRALAADPGNDELIRRAFLLRVSDGRIAEAAVLAQRIVEHDGRAGLAGVVLVEQALKAGNYVKAAELAQNMPRDGAQRFSTPLLLAWAEIGRHDRTAARAAIDSMAGPNGLAPLHDLHAAMVDDFADRIDDAAAGYEKLIAAGQTPSWRVVELAGNFFERHNRGGDAKRLYERVRAEQGLVDVAAGGLARIAEGKIPPRIIKTPAEGAAEGLFDLAGLLNAPATGEVALVYGRLALDLAPHFALAQMLVAELRDGESHPADALALYRAVEPPSPYAWMAQLRAAVELDSLDRTAEAAKQLEAMAAARPGRAEALVELGDILRSHKRFGEAVEAYDRAIARTPHPRTDDWRLFYSRGVALERSGRWPEAEADLKHALSLQPEQPLVLNYLGYSWIDKGANLDDALGMIRRAVDLRPDDGYIVDSLGWAYFRLHDFSRATQFLERAIELLPEDPTINDHLGDAYWRAGRQAEARYQWQRALQFQPEADEVKGIESKLDHGLAASTSVSGGG